MEHIITIGLDLAKNVFQVHGIDAAGKVLVRRQLRGGDVLQFFDGLPRCFVAMEPAYRSSLGSWIHQAAGPAAIASLNQPDTWLQPGGNFSAGFPQL